jgi:hypothetical protein
MADITLPPITRRPQSKAASTITAAALLAALLMLITILISLNWSAVLSRARDCNIKRGAFSSGFNGGFDVDRRACSLQSDAMPMGVP